MSAKVDITTGRGKFRGISSDLTTYSASEQAVPLDPSDTSGNVGTLTFGATEEPDSRLLYGNSILLSDEFSGKVSGIISQVTSNDSRFMNNPATFGLDVGNDGTLGLDVDNSLNLLVVDRQAQPYVGNLSNALVYYLGLCGITTGYKIDDSYQDINIAFPGWYGEVWLHLKRLGQVYNFDISQVSDYIYIRPIRQNSAVLSRDSKRTWNIGDGRLAKTVAITKYENKFRSNFLVYPYGGWNPDIAQATGFGPLEAGETQTFTLNINTSLQSVVQPIAVNSVSSTEMSNSVYAVFGGDKLPIPAAQWRAGGGQLSVAIGEDTKTLIVTVTASSDSQYAPYTVGMSSGDTSYNSLRVMGTGVVQNEVTRTYVTGVSEDRSQQDVVQINDNEFISTDDDLNQAFARAMFTYSMPQMSVSATASYINKRGQTGEIVSHTVDYVDSFFSPQTVNQVDTFFAGYTVDGVKAYFDAMILDNFDNQVFGNACGTRVPLRDNIYRITSASINASQIAYQATYDTTVDDSDPQYTGMSVDQVDARWADYTVDEQVLVAMDA